MLLVLSQVVLFENLCSSEEEQNNVDQEYDVEKNLQSLTRAEHVQVKSQVTADIGDGTEEADVGERVPNLNEETLWVENIPASLVPRELILFAVKQRFPIVRLLAHVTAKICLHIVRV